jgi:hypothetical protein
MADGTALEGLEPLGPCPEPLDLGSEPLGTRGKGVKWPVWGENRIPLQDFSHFSFWDLVLERKRFKRFKAVQYGSGGN